MKNLYRMVITLTFIAGCSDQGDITRPDIGGMPEIEISQTTVDLTAPAGDSATAVLRIRNTGDEVLQVTNVTATGAGFAVREWSREIAPSDSGTVVVRYTAGTANATGSLTIISNATPATVAVALIGNPAGVPPVVRFATDVLPILQVSCANVGCHIASTASGGFTATSYQSARSRVTPGNPATSLIWNMLQPRGGMPLDGGPLPAAQQETIRQWILTGANP